MASILLENVTKAYGHFTILDALNLRIEDGEFVTIVGPSGCGKSTLLRMIAGLDTVTDGNLFFDGNRVNNVEPKDRGVAMVFQSYALYPHLSVFGNVAFGLKGRMAKSDIEPKVTDVLQRLQLSHLADRLPRHLSGGQRQRVAIARAISREPKVMLFDEPLSNLDAGLRNQTRMEIARLHKSLGATTIYVTHDQAEAMTLSDKIVILNKGKIEQSGSPLELYRRPANRFVAEFIGSPKINVLTLPDADLLFPDRSTVFDGERGDLLIGLRAQELHAVPPADAHLQGRVVLIEEHGDRAYVFVETLESGTAIVMEMTHMENLAAGEIIGIESRVTRPLFFGKKDGRVIEDVHP